MCEAYGSSASSSSTTFCIQEHLCGHLERKVSDARTTRLHVVIVLNDEQGAW